MLRAGLTGGTSGAGWDNVAWIGPWDIDLADVRRPVHLWYGGQDPLVQAATGPWLAHQLRDATLHLREGDGHLGVIEHARELLQTLTAD